VDAGLPQIAEGKRMVLLTSHRRENHGDGLAHICDAVTELVAAGDVEVIYPVHLNPLVKDAVQSAWAMWRCAPDCAAGLPGLCAPDAARFFVLTDSGGVQEEAPALGKPVLLLRDVTERPRWSKPVWSSWWAQTNSASSALPTSCCMTALPMHA
jgi:UDP-N-acetylglucosamine 2-epimerase (non-hydrolysing)